MAKKNETRKYKVCIIICTSCKVTFAANKLTSNHVPSWFMVQEQILVYSVIMCMTHIKS